MNTNFIQLFLSRVLTVFLCLFLLLQGQFLFGSKPAGSKSAQGSQVEKQEKELIKELKEKLEELEEKVEKSKELEKWLEDPKGELKSAIKDKIKEKVEEELTNFEKWVFGPEVHTVLDQIFKKIHDKLVSERRSSEFSKQKGSKCKHEILNFAYHVTFDLKDKKMFREFARMSVDIYKTIFDILSGKAAPDWADSIMEWFKSKIKDKYKELLQEWYQELFSESFEESPKDVVCYPPPPESADESDYKQYPGADCEPEVKAMWYPKIGQYTVIIRGDCECLKAAGNDWIGKWEVHAKGRVIPQPKASGDEIILEYLVTSPRIYIYSSDEDCGCETSRANIKTNVKAHWEGPLEPGQSGRFTVTAVDDKGKRVGIISAKSQGLSDVTTGWEPMALGLPSPTATFVFDVAKPRRHGKWRILFFLTTNKGPSWGGMWIEVKNVAPRIDKIEPDPGAKAKPDENMQMKDIKITVIDENADINNWREVDVRDLELMNHPKGLDTENKDTKIHNRLQFSVNKNTGTYIFKFSRNYGKVTLPHMHGEFETKVRIKDDGDPALWSVPTPIKLEVIDVPPKILLRNADPKYVHSGDDKVITLKLCVSDDNGWEDIKQENSYIDATAAGGKKFVIKDSKEKEIKDETIYVTEKFRHTILQTKVPVTIPIHVEDRAPDEDFPKAVLHKLDNKDLKIKAGDEPPEIKAYGFIYKMGGDPDPHQREGLCPGQPFKIGALVTDPEGDTIGKVIATFDKREIDLAIAPGEKTHTGTTTAPLKPRKYKVKFKAWQTKPKRLKAKKVEELYLTVISCPDEKPEITKPAAQGIVTRVDVASGVNMAGKQAIKIKVSGSMGTSLDEILVKIPKKRLQEASAGSLPEGWTMSIAKENLVFSGPEIQTPCHLRIDLGRTLLKKTDVEVMLDGNRLFRKRGLKVVKGPRIRLSDNFDDVLKFPPIVSLGDQIEFMPLDFEKTPLGGIWEVSGEPAIEIPGKGRYIAALPDSLIEGESISLSYTDPYGIELFRSDALPDIQIVSPVESEFPFISDVTRFAFAADLICVCGSFPNLSSRNGLLLNGQSLDSPVSASSHVVVLRPPENIKPGTHEIGGNPEAGYSQENKHPFTVIEVQGFIDQDVIRRGGSTQLSLTVVGTDEVLQLELKNSTPKIIKLEGGNHQVISTSGGANNMLERTVTGLKRGDFILDYKLVLDFCPCREK